MTNPVLPPEFKPVVSGYSISDPGGVLRMTKRLIREGQENSLASTLEISAAYQAIAHQTADHEEAVRAFVEKRKPVFK